jgi:ParB-like nuclease domain
VSNNGHNGERYHVEYEVVYLDVKAIRQSPENALLYGEPDGDGENVDWLANSIDRLGLAEPLIVTADDYILSGHRRFEACTQLGWTQIPCRIKHDLHRADMSTEDYMKLLSDYNPQRIKTVDAILRETILQVDEATLEDMGGDRPQLIESTFAPTEEPEFMDVEGEKGVEPIGPRRQEFLAAVVKIVNELKEYWPLSIRQIHYQLLNNPPLKQTPPERSRFSKEELEARNRYRNDRGSYQALSRLCTSARYLGHVPFHAVDDPTRTSVPNMGWADIRDFVEYEIKNFLTGYNLDLQRSQPVHLEVFCEKNTLLSIAAPICEQYNVPLTSGRGFAGPSIWRKMAMRFRRSGKHRMVVLAVSDYDPEGFELVDDCYRSLRDLHGIRMIALHRVAVTEDQIEELDLHSDFNPAKEESTRYDKFVERTGDDKTWECESLPPDYLRDALQESIEANMNTEIFERANEQENKDRGALLELKNKLSHYFGK